MSWSIMASGMAWSEVLGLGGDGLGLAGSGDSGGSSSIDRKPEPGEPVTQVSWNDAKAFCAWLPTGSGALPFSARQFTCPAAALTSAQGAFRTAQAMFPGAPKPTC
jgi:formylglycine-generating enzyme required for sulfatase activity